MCDKDLLETGIFDTEIIWTDRTETRYDWRELWAQDLKMWRGWGVQDGQYSLSFNVTNGVHKNRHVECEMRRFVPTARTGGRDHTNVVYLDFAAGDRDSQSTAATDELYSGSPVSPTGTGFGKLRRLSGMFGSKAPPPTLSKDRHRPSRASFALQASLPLVAEDDFFANARYLAVQFSEVKDAHGRDIEAASKGQLSPFPCTFSCPFPRQPTRGTGLC